MSDSLTKVSSQLRGPLGPGPSGKSFDSEGARVGHSLKNP